jgi:hypothetical protein
MFRRDIDCRMWIPLQMNIQEDNYHKIVGLMRQFQRDTYWWSRWLE